MKRKCGKITFPANWTRILEMSFFRWYCRWRLVALPMMSFLCLLSWFLTSVLVSLLSFQCDVVFPVLVVFFFFLLPSFLIDVVFYTGVSFPVQVVFHFIVVFLSRLLFGCCCFLIDVAF